MMERNEWLVSNATCKGCKYYGTIGGGYGRCCNYTLQTGNVRKNPPAQCEVKETKNKRSKRSKADDAFFKGWEAARMKR